MSRARTEGQTKDEIRNKLREEIRGQILRDNPDIKYSGFEMMTLIGLRIKEIEKKEHGRY